METTSVTGVSASTPGAAPCTTVHRQPFHIAYKSRDIQVLLLEKSFPFHVFGRRRWYGANGMIRRPRSVILIS